MDCATEKGEEMKNKSKGNFFDFIQTCTKDQDLTKKFLDLYYTKDITPEDLLKFFEDEQYDGVSLEDCEKLLEFLNMGKNPKTSKLPWDFYHRPDKKY